MTVVKDDISGVLVCEWQWHWCWWCDEGYDSGGLGRTGCCQFFRVMEWHDRKGQLLFQASSGHQQLSEFIGTLV